MEDYCVIAPLLFLDSMSASTFTFDSSSNQDVTDFAFSSVLRSFVPLLFYYFFSFNSINV